jgi:ribosomal protein S18 acetylase RimI-like enzyme
MMDASTDITKVEKEEIGLLQHISIQTFTETFADHNTENDMKTYVSENLHLEKLTSEFNTHGSSFYFLRLGTELSGYMKLNEGASQTMPGKEHAMEIERIYILKTFHGKQLGKRLLYKAIAIAKEKKYSQIWLGVWEHNTKAIVFYERNHFVKTGSHAFVLGQDVQTDHIMELNLN